MQVKQTSKYWYVAKRGRETREFSDEDYKQWLNEQPCALCSKSPCEAHHEPPVGNSGRDHAEYWTRAVPLCPDCHRDRTDERVNKWRRDDLRAMAQGRYPRWFINDRFNTIGG